MSVREMLLNGSIFENKSIIKSVAFALDENGHCDVPAEEGNFFLLKDKTRAVTLINREKTRIKM